MKILNLSLDQLVLEKNSPSAARTVEYGNLVERYTIIVPSQKNEIRDLSERVRVYGAGGAGKLIRFLNLYRAAKKLLRQEKYDVITVQDQYYLAWLGFILAKKNRVGLEIQVHGFEKYRGLRKLIAGYVLPRAEAVRCVSQRLKRQLINDFGVGEGRITVVPIYTELKITDNEPSLYGGGDDLIFLTVSRLVPVKNLSLAISAMAEVVKKYPSAVLWIAGDGPERKNLKFKIENLKLTNNIKLLGWQNDLSPFYGQADAFLLTSSYEGWGLAAIEAASHGLPIIMTDVGCAGEVFKNNESGIIIPVGDRGALVGAMERILQNGAWRQKIGEMARKAVGALPLKQETLDLYSASWRKAAKL